MRYNRGLTPIKESEETIKNDNGKRMEDIAQDKRDNVDSTFVVNKDMSPRDSGEVLYQYPEFNKDGDENQEKIVNPDRINESAEDSTQINKKHKDDKFEAENENIYDTIFGKENEGIVHTFVTNTDLEHMDPEEVFYRFPEFNKGINEHMNLSDRTTRRTLLSMNEVAQTTLLTSLTSKLYDNIVNKIDDIDYGNIPATKGDVSKLDNYDQVVSCIELMKGILQEYKQDTKPVDEIALALSNVQSRKDLFMRGYRYNSELPMVVYCNIVLAIIGSISYLIASCVEFIKTPKQENFELALDRVAYAKSKDYILFDSLRKFNKACKSGDLDKAMENVLQKKIKNESAAISVGTAAVAAIGALLLVVLPLLREIVFLFYYTRMKVSDFFDIQADILQMNAYNIQANHSLTVDKDSEKVIARQLKLVEKFRKIANFFAIKFKKAEVDSDREYNATQRKFKVDEVIDDTSGNVSSLF